MIQRVGGRWAACLLALVILVQVFSLSTLSLIHPVWGDEGSYADPARTFALNGTFGSNLFAGNYGMEKSVTIYGRLLMGSLGMAFRLFGFGPAQGRLVSWLSGVVLLVLCWLMTLRLSGSKLAAALSAAILSTLYLFIQGTHTIRPELLLTAIAMAGLYSLIVAIDSGDWRLFGLAGLLGVLTVDVHLNGLAIAPALGLVAIYRMGWREIFRKSGLSFIGGMLLGVAWWFGVHVLPDPALFQLQRQDWGQVARPPLTMLITDPANAIAYQISRFTAPGTVNKTMVFTVAFWLVCLAVVGAWWWLGRSDTKTDAVKAERRRLSTPFVYAVALSVIMALIVDQKLDHYYNLTLPALSIATAVYWVALRGAWRRAASAAIALSIAFSLAGVGYAFVRFQGNDFGSYTARLRRLIPEGSTVFGPADISLGMSGYTYIGYTPRLYEGDRHGTYLIVAQDYLAQAEKSDPRLARILRDEGSLVGQVSDKTYGRALAATAGGSEYVTSVFRLK